jgi:hypothetical protein
MNEEAEVYVMLCEKEKIFLNQGQNVSFIRVQGAEPAKDRVSDVVLVGHWVGNIHNR